MKRTNLALALAALLAAAAQADPRPNVLFIAIDDLRNDLGVFGVPHAKTPQIDAFAATARAFSHHYAQVPTCGASRGSLMRGRYPDKPVHVTNFSIRNTSTEWAADSLPGLFKRAGYGTYSLGKITHHPGNRTGKAWAELPEELPGVWDKAWIPSGPWPTPEAIMHGYANGAARVRGESLPMEVFDGPDEAYPDAWVAAEAAAALHEYARSGQPFFFAVGFFKPHLPFAIPKKWHDLHAANVPDLPEAVAAKRDWPSGWHTSVELREAYGQERGLDPDTHPEYARFLREGYAASISYMDAQIGRLLEALEESGLADNTIVVLWSDHGLLLGEHAIWGKHAIYEEALRCPLMIRYPGLPNPGAISKALVETVDILPTLADICGLDAPPQLDGRSLRPQLEDAAAPSTKPAFAFWRDGQRSVRAERWRLVVHPSKNGAADRYELFDYATDPGETRNWAIEKPAIVRELLTLLDNAPKPSEG